MGLLKNGLFYFIVNGNLYPKDIRVATLSTDCFEVIEDGSALISFPENNDTFTLPADEAFNRLYSLAYPEPSADDEYPEQMFDYYITPTNISESGGCFFAVANECDLRIVGGTVECLLEDSVKGVHYWGKIKDPKIEEVVVSKEEMNRITSDLNKYMTSIVGCKEKNQ
ncbi:Imm42 family immunity protein [Phytopseudomonas flavescens]|uniref:Imm42 family immunity protein n=1 Tax=Phytopseudomonas flavescens TaxID=29435 RepID=UPI00350E3AFD